MRDIEEMIKLKCGVFLSEEDIAAVEACSEADADDSREAHGGHDVHESHEAHVDMCCEECLVHEDAVEKVKRSLPQDDKLKQVADLYKKFGDFTRVRIMYMLSVSELCVCDLSDLLDMSQPAVSNHLSVLKKANLVKSHREGKMMFYSLADSHVETILAQGLEHVEE